ncbi:MAG: glycosyl transferase, partial [Methylocystis sp.]
MLGLLQILVDAVAYSCLLILVAIGVGYLIVIGRFFYDQIQGAVDPHTPVPAEAELPHVLLQIPVFNEPLVTEQSLRCVTQLDWPREKLRIQLLDDSTDETSVRAACVIEELSATGAMIDHIRRT